MEQTISNFKERSYSNKYFISIRLCVPGVDDLIILYLSKASSSIHVPLDGGTGMGKAK